MDDGMPCIAEVVAPALSFADFGDVFVLTQVSKNWRASLAVAEMEIFLHLLQKYRPILMLFSDRMENIPANAQPSTRWKMLFRLAYELLKSSDQDAPVRPSLVGHPKLKDHPKLREADVLDPTLVRNIWNAISKQNKNAKKPNVTFSQLINGVAQYKKDSAEMLDLILQADFNDVVGEIGQRLRKGRKYEKDGSISLKDEWVVGIFDEIRSQGEEQSIVIDAWMAAYLSPEEKRKFLVQESKLVEMIGLEVNCRGVGIPSRAGSTRKRRRRIEFRVFPTPRVRGWWW